MVAKSFLPPNSSRTAADYYPSALHEEALARLAYLAEKGSACGLLLGPGGCGKSLVLSRFAQQQRFGGAAVAAVSALGVSPAELLLAMGTEWRADVRVSDDLPLLWQKVTDRLRVLGIEQLPALLLVDDLDVAQAETAALVDRLQAFAESTGANLVLIAAAEGRHQDKLTTHFLARAELRAELDVWTADESRGFLQQWQSQRGGEHQEFDQQAMEVLHDLAEGVPRRARQLAELTMLAGSRSADGPLSENVVEAAYEELCIGR